MNSFVKFIFSLLLCGSALAFGIVLFADIHGSNERALNTVVEESRFGQVIARQSGRVRRIEIAVEWQQINAMREVMETSLLVRRFGLDEQGNDVALPIERVRIPRNSVSVDGIMLEFGQDFPAEYQNLRKATLAYFSHVYGTSEPELDRFPLMEDGKIPVATQMHLDHLTYYELKLWKFLWYLIATPKQAKLNDLKVIHLRPETWLATNGTVYMVFVGIEGVTHAEENDPAILGDMLQEAATMDEKEARAHRTVFK